MPRARRQQVGVPAAEFSACSGPNPDPFCAGCRTDARRLYIKMGFRGYPLPFRRRQPQAAFSRSLRCVGGFYVRAESSAAKVSLHYSVNGEMRLPSRGTAMLRGPHGSCQGVPRAEPPSCPQQTGQAGEMLPPPARPDLRAGPCHGGQMWPSAAAAGFHSREFHNIYFFCLSRFSRAGVALGSHLVG